jgi:hypothetical protein
MYTGPNNISKDGLLIYIDPSNAKSYPRSGNVAYDLMGNSNITMNGTTSIVSGSISGSNLTVPFISLTGTGSANYGSFSNTSVFGVNNSSYEFVALWRTLGTGGPDTLFSREQSRFYITANINGNGVLGGFVRGNGYPTSGQFENALTGTGTVTTNTWYHLVFTVDFSSTFAVYKNGVLAGSTNISTLGTGFINPSSGDAVLGSRYGGGGTSGTKMTGGIGLFKFYNRALTATEINQNYNSLKPRFNLL